MTMSAKRVLSDRPLCGDRTTKRRRGSTTAHSSQLLTTISDKGQPEYERVESYPKNHNSSDHVSYESSLVDGDSETTSGTDLDDTLKNSSSDDDGEDEANSAEDIEESSASNGHSSEEDERVQELSVLRKPPISAMNQASDLRTRLSTFLPELRKANADLQNSPDGRVNRLDEVPEDEEHYIEMNLGLGVLKEKMADNTQADGVKLKYDHSASSSEESDRDSVDSKTEPDGCKAKRTALDAIMQGRRPMKKKPNIQELPGS